MLPRVSLAALCRLNACAECGRAFSGSAGHVSRSHGCFCGCLLLACAVREVDFSGGGLADRTRVRCGTIVNSDLMRFSPGESYFNYLHQLRNSLK